MKKTASILGLAGLLALGTASWAQDPVPAGDVETRVTTETTIDHGNPDDAFAATEADYTTMPATGGAPIAMAIFGTLTAAGAYLTRRKLG